MNEKEQLKAELQRIRERLQEIDHDSRSTFGKNLLHWRTQRGLRQEDLANAVGVSRVQITNMERGACDTSMSRLLRICEVLQVTPNDLLLEIDTTGSRF